MSKSSNYFKFILMNAPMPLTPRCLDEKLIDLNNLKDKKEFEYKEYTLTIGLLFENVIFLCKSSKNDNLYQLKESYEELIFHILIIFNPLKINSRLIRFLFLKLLQIFMIY